MRSIRRPPSWTQHEPVTLTARLTMRQTERVGHSRGPIPRNIWVVSIALFLSAFVATLVAASLLLTPQLDSIWRLNPVARSLVRRACHDRRLVGLGRGDHRGGRRVRNAGWSEVGMVARDRCGRGEWGGGSSAGRAWRVGSGGRGVGRRPRTRSPAAVPERTSLRSIGSRIRMVIEAPPMIPGYRHPDHEPSIQGIRGEIERNEFPSRGSPVESGLPLHPQIARRSPPIGGLLRAWRAARSPSHGDRTLPHNDPSQNSHVMPPS
jgi:hypothetical protein